MVPANPALIGNNRFLGELGGTEHRCGHKREVTDQDGTRRQLKNLAINRAIDRSESDFL